jgi:uncharacterized iron-regulated membrane protein
VDLSTRTAGDAFLVAQRVLHTGDAFGIAGRVLLCIAGLMPGLFVATGSIMWLRGRRTRAALSARAA